MPICEFYHGLKIKILYRSEPKPNLIDRNMKVLCFNGKVSDGVLPWWLDIDINNWSEPDQNLADFNAVKMRYWLRRTLILSSETLLDCGYKNQIWPRANRKNRKSISTYGATVLLRDQKMEKIAETTVERSFLSDSVVQHRGSKVTIVVILDSETLILNWRYNSVLILNRRW